MLDASTAAHDEQILAKLELATRLGAVAGDARDLVELFRALYQESARVMDATIFMFALYDDASQTVEVVRQVDRGVEHEGGSFPLGKGFTSEVIRAGAPKLVRHWASEGPPIRLLYGTEAGELVTPQSAAIVPILSGSRVIGVLSAQSYRPEAYDATHLLALGAIAAQAGATIKHLRATQQMALEHERHAQLLEAALAGMSDALVIVDAQGSIVRLNRAARDLLRLDTATLVLGQPLERQRLELWPDASREIAEAILPAIESIRAGENVDGLDIELRTGERRVLNVTAAALPSSQKGPQGGVVIFRDVTLQRDLDRLRQDIFEMAWHDMQAPISVIRGHGELLERRVGDGRLDRDAIQRDAAKIIKHADRLSEMLNTLFDISCLEAGVLSIAPWPTDLCALARDIADEMRPTARRFINVSAEGEIVGEWDERRIRQVLMNLLSNALKYSQEGSTVTVRVVSDGQTAVVSVADEGIGLDEGEIAQLFRRRFRAESARSVRGEGLGLYLATGIVGAHGGRMWAESPGHGQGSTFCFALPLTASPAAGAVA